MNLEEGKKISTDPLGLQTIFYTVDKDNLVFETDLKKIIENINKEIDIRALKSYFEYGFLPSGHTLIKNVFRIPPGSTVKLTNKSVSIENYWKLNWKKQNNSEQWFAKEIKHALYDSIQHNISENDKIGILLSGGLDSACILASLKKFHDDIKTFTIGTEWEDNIELKLARKISDFYNTDHYEIILESKDLHRLIYDYMRYSYIPNNSLFEIRAFKAMEKAKQLGVNKIFSGSGSDGIFGGYGDLSSIVKISNALPPFCKYFFSDLSQVFGDSKISKGISILSMKNPYEYGSLSGIQNRKILNSLIDEKIIKYPIIESNTNNLEKLDKIYDYFLRGIYPNMEILKHIQAANANSLKMELSFWNEKLVNLSTQIPWDLKINGRIKKYILRATFKDLLPDEIVNAKRKVAPITNPANYMFKAGLDQLLESIIKENNHNLYKDNTKINNLISKSKNPKISRDLWTILIFEVWYNIFIKEKSIYTA